MRRPFSSKKNKRRHVRYPWPWPSAEHLAVWGMYHCVYWGGLAEIDNEGNRWVQYPGRARQLLWDGKSPVRINSMVRRPGEFVMFRSIRPRRRNRTFYHAWAKAMKRSGFYSYTYHPTLRPYEVDEQTEELRRIITEGVERCTIQDLAKKIDLDVINAFLDGKSFGDPEPGSLNP